MREVSPSEPLEEAWAILLRSAIQEDNSEAVNWVAGPQGGRPWFHAFLSPLNHYSDERKWTEFPAKKPLSLMIGGKKHGFLMFPADVPLNKSSEM